MTAAGGPPAGSFNISSALRALGIRDPRVIPQVGQQLQPTISFGEFETFTPEVIEARGLVFAQPLASGVGNSQLIKMLSVAPGGTIIEQVSVELQTPGTGTVFLFSAPTDTGGNVDVVPVWTIGGQALVNLWTRSAIFIGAVVIPPGGSGVAAGVPFPALREPDMFARVWIPASWRFFIGLQATTQITNILVRFREIPQAQGAQ